MRYDPQKHHRRSIRLKGYDYTSPGLYFVTICTQGGVCLFGEVVDEVMHLNPLGRVVDTYWSRIPRHFPHVRLDTWVVMPNHVHGIIVITDTPTTNNRDHPDTYDTCRGEAIPVRSPGIQGHTNSASSPAANGDARIASPLPEPPHQPPPHPRSAPPGSLGAILGNFQSITARRINRMRHTPGQRVWQRNYWEHIIRNERAYKHIWHYIHNNPARWEEDQLHPDAPPNPFNREVTI